MYRYKSVNPEKYMRKNVHVYPTTPYVRENQDKGRHILRNVWVSKPI